MLNVIKVIIKIHKKWVKLCLFPFSTFEEIKINNYKYIFLIFYPYETMVSALNSFL